jgi:hypothetical protein
MVALGRPKSTTGHNAIRKRPSDVPPLVDSSGAWPVSSLIASTTTSKSRPGGVRNASPEMRARTLAPGASRSAISSTIFTRSAPR